MNSFDREVDELLDGLEEELDRFDDLLDDISVLRVEGPDGEPDVDFTPAIQLIAEFLFKVSTHLEPETRDLIRQYRRYWHGENGPTLDELNSARLALCSRYTGSQTLMDLQFLTAAEPWETQQDGVGYYLCIALRRDGVSVPEIKEALRGCYESMNALIHAKRGRA